MDKIKKILLGEKGMGIVNFLFLLALCFRNSGVIFVAYAVWILYLLYAIKNTQSKAVKGINALFMLFAAVMLVINLYLFIRAVR